MKKVLDISIKVWYNSGIRLGDCLFPSMESPMAKKNWIAGAVKNKGGLHRSLGVPAGKKIPASKVAAAAKKGGTVGKQARLAQTLGKMRKK